MAKLRSLKYLNDDIFAREWTLARIESQGYGPRKVEQELRTKGVAQPLIREVIRESFDESDVRKRATSLLEQRFKGKDLSDVKMVRRAAAFLQRRGYDNRVIFDLLKQPLEED